MNHFFFNMNKKSANGECDLNEGDLREGLLPLILNMKFPI